MTLSGSSKDILANHSTISKKKNRSLFMIRPTMFEKYTATYIQAFKAAQRKQLITIQQHLGTAAKQCHLVMSTSSYFQSHVQNSYFPY